ncbi:hypothetical protein [Halalkalibacter krulwichiae]|uniref:Uncharacterized protein n=1 Tax=Halalkalibacter krulwichiae TaxID=199441 RepID=A0A1X9M7V2_9BACI|nr:hypothetical protein [Halalkalibacter krulwichiae]ARK28680.1 hypothetical protein BkAM31D_01780 [Halalkalibacter krulwichiae]
MYDEELRKKELKLLIKKKRKREQRDWRLTMKRLKQFQNDSLNHKTSRTDR